ncbi:MAG TPA: hypothetical protein PLR99_26795, partial [Polyangiaceae bacterium]|nr:hypothetical protein [Polyangiaceae bacterium]
MTSSKSTLPSRAAILELLAEQDHAVHAHEIGMKLGVPEALYPGLLRLLDDLVFDGLLSARDGHKFRTSSRGRAREHESVCAKRPTLTPGAGAGEGRREREGEAGDG